MSENKKIGGILIENVIKQNKLSATIIGFGINVNQTEFDYLPQASSMRLISGRVYVLEEVLQAILVKLQNNFKILEKSKFEILKRAMKNICSEKISLQPLEMSKGNCFQGT